MHSLDFQGVQHRGWCPIQNRNPLKILFVLRVGWGFKVSSSVECLTRRRLFDQVQLTSFDFTFVCLFFFCLASVSGGLEWSLDRSRLRWENFPRAKILFTDFALFRVQAMEIQGLDRCRFPVYRSLRLVTEIKIGWGFFFQQRPSGKDPRCLFLVESVR